MDPRVQAKIDEVMELIEKQKRENPNKKSIPNYVQSPDGLTKGIRNQREADAFMAELEALIKSNPNPPF